jgi:hypothetical protein
MSEEATSSSEALDPAPSFQEAANKVMVRKEQELRNPKYAAQSLSTLHTYAVPAAGSD